VKSVTTNTKTTGAQLWQESTRKPITHSKTRLLDYNYSAANVTNSVFYSKNVATSGPIATSKQKHPVILRPNP